MKGLIFVISGPSGSGKTTLAERLFKDEALKQELVKSVSVTTRPRRSGEKDKREYFFLTQGQFLREKREQKLLEWTRYLSYYYATRKSTVDKALAKGKSLVLCLDLKGAARVKKLYPKNCVSIFIKPPSLAVLRNRIQGRCSLTKKEEIHKRLELARQELTSSCKYDYCLVNKNLAQAEKRLREIVLREINNIK